MRFAILLKADNDTEAGAMPTEQLIRDMANYNDELIKAGIMLAGEGLQPSSRGARVSFEPGKVTVVDGPFAETKELIAGFWIWNVKSKEEAIEWVKRVPMPMLCGRAEIEIRQIYEMTDFGDAMTPELLAQEERQRAALSA
jgi:hypothetical protein